MITFFSRQNPAGLALATALATALAAVVLLVASARPGRADDPLVAFRSPSGNAHCVIDTGSGPEAVVSCELRAFTGPAPPRPKDCELDWVPGASLDGKGRVSLFSCRGDTIRTADSRVLAYGTSISHGPITCSSATTGVSCVLKSGRGFLVSRAAIRKL